MVNNNLVGGWALPLWKMMEFVSWDYDIPNRKLKHVPNHQPDIDLHSYPRISPRILTPSPSIAGLWPTSFAPSLRILGEVDLKDDLFGDWRWKFQHISALYQTPRLSYLGMEVS